MREVIYLFQILLVAGNVWMAWYHSKLIKAEKKINHSLWGGAYLMAATLLSWSIHNHWLLLLSLFIRKVVFDLSLNLFLNRQLFFVSSETTSVIDKWHNRLFGKKSEIYMGVYMLVIVILNTLIFNKIL